MKSTLISLAFLGIFSSCIVEVDLNPPYVNIENIDEYETRDIINEVWSNGVLVFEEVRLDTWLEIEFRNRGGLSAENVWAEVIFYDGNYEIHATTIYLPDLRAGNSYVYNLQTGFESLYDYTDYNVSVYWE